MSSNRLFLVCSHHPNLADAFCIGERTGNDSQYIAPHMRKLDGWYTKHMGCGRGLDHFQLALNRPADWDVAPPAENTTAGAVRLALVNGAH